VFTVCQKARASSIVEGGSGLLFAINRLIGFLNNGKFLNRCLSTLTLAIAMSDLSLKRWTAAGGSMIQRQAGKDDADTLDQLRERVAKDAPYNMELRIRLAHKHGEDISMGRFSEVANDLHIGQIDYGPIGKKLPHVALDTEISREEMAPLGSKTRSEDEFWNWCIKCADGSLPKPDDTASGQVGFDKDLYHDFYTNPDRANLNRETNKEGKQDPDVVLEREKLCATWLFRADSKAKSMGELKSYLPFVIIFFIYILTVSRLSKLGNVESLYRSLVDAPIAASFGGIQKTIMDARNTDQIMQWLKGPLIDTVWYSHGDALGNLCTVDAYGYDSSVCKYQYVQNYNILLGGVVIRQLRVSPQSCTSGFDINTLPSYAADDYDSLSGSGTDICYKSYSAGTRQTTDYYDSTGTNRWVYSEAKDVEHKTDPQSFSDFVPAKSLYTGEEYPGGGYEVHLPISHKDNATATIEKMVSTEWFDQGTRAIFIEFSTYNPMSYEFTTARIMIESTELGSIYVTPKFSSIDIYRYNLNTPNDIWMRALEIILLIFVFFFIIQKCQLVYNEQWTYAMRFVGSPQVIRSDHEKMLKEVFDELASDEYGSRVTPESRVQRAELFDRLIDAHDIVHFVHKHVYNGSPTYKTIFLWSLNRAIRRTISWEEFKAYLSPTPDQLGFGGANAFESSFWEIADLLNLFLFTYSIYMRLHWHTSEQVLNYNLENAVTTYYDLQGVASYLDQQSNLLGANALLTAFKLLKYFQTQSAVNSVWQTVKYASDFMMYFFIIFFVILFMFAFCGITLFGTHLRNWADIPNTMTTLICIVLGQFNYNQIKEVESDFAMIYFLSFIFIIYLILINMILAIIGNSYRKTIRALLSRRGLIVNAIEDCKKAYMKKHKEHFKELESVQERADLVESAVPLLLAGETMELSHYVMVVVMLIYKKIFGYVDIVADSIDNTGDMLKNTAHHFKNKTMGGGAEEEYLEESDEEEANSVRRADKAQGRAVDTIKSLSEMGLLKVAVSQLEHENRVKARERGDGANFGRYSRDSTTGAPLSPVAVGSRRSSAEEMASPGGGARVSVAVASMMKAQDEAFQKEVQAFVDNGTRELGGEVEALRGHYAALVATNDWEPEKHEFIARQLDAVESAANQLGEHGIAEDARAVAKGVREMKNKIALLGNNLL